MATINLLATIMACQFFKDKNLNEQKPKYNFQIEICNCALVLSAGSCSIFACSPTTRFVLQMRVGRLTSTQRHTQNIPPLPQVWDLTIPQWCSTLQHVEVLLYWMRSLGPVHRAKLWPRTPSETIIVLAGVPKTTLLQRGRPQVFTFNLYEWSE